MSAKLGLLSIACVQLGPRKLSVMQSSGVSAMQGLSTEVNGKTVWTFRIVHYIVGVHFLGVPLSRIPLYVHWLHSIKLTITHF